MFILSRNLGWAVLVLVFGILAKNGCYAKCNAQDAAIGDIPEPLLMWCAEWEKYRNVEAFYTTSRIPEGWKYEEGVLRIDFRNRNYYENTKYWLIDQGKIEPLYYERFGSIVGGNIRGYNTDDSPARLQSKSRSIGVMGKIPPTGRRNERSHCFYFLGFEVTAGLTEEWSITELVERSKTIRAENLRYTYTFLDVFSIGDEQLVYDVRVTLDPEHSFLAKEIEHFERVKNKSTSRCVWRCEEFGQVEGLWFPVTCTMLSKTPEGVLYGDVKTVDLNSVRLNQPWKDSDYEVTFPKDKLVGDDDGVLYRDGVVVEESYKKSRSNTSVQSSPPSRVSWWSSNWLLGGVGLVLGVVLFGVVLRHVTSIM